ncbi:MAG TPA: NUDIX hydrolase [Burkholderiales bacterium]|nr:NUDIX hydrolase [Burkholderiales bacterium]
MSDSESDFTEHTLDSKTVYRGRLLHVLEDEVRMPDGKSARREYIRHPGAVAMIPMLDAETVVLVRQYRYPARRHFYEIPAGKIDPGEEPLQTGKRELREECGYEARVWRRLTTLDPCIGYSDERIELYMAEDLTRVQRAPEEGEFLEELTLRLPLAMEWVRSGRITDVKTIIGLVWAAKLL